MYELARTMTHTHTHTHTHGKKRAIYASALLIISAAAYLFGAYSFSRGIWPIDLLRNLKSTIHGAGITSAGEFDDFGRLIKFPGKTKVECPTQTSRTGVVLVIGQSNSANHAETSYSTKHPNQVFNAFNGECFVAESPLIGATGERGEFITLMADKLIESRVYDSVVIISSGIGGTPISRWQADGDLNLMLLDTVSSLSKMYLITDVIWHQGESDYNNSTSAKVYEKSFHSLLETLRPYTDKAKIFIAVATRCNQVGWSSGNPTAQGQRALVDMDKVFLGADTDLLIGQSERYDRCHFSFDGQKIAASAFANAIREVRARSTPTSPPPV